MTIKQAIQTVDETKPNQVSEKLKVAWLSDLDKRIFDEILKTHEYDEDMPDTFIGYTVAEEEGQEGTDQDTELLVPSPFDMIYRWHLEMQIDLMNMEMEKYNNSAALYSNAWDEFARWWQRGHRPIGRGVCWHF